MERLKVETNKVYPVDVVCKTHGNIASSIPPSEAEALIVAHRENKKCFEHIDVNLRTDKPQIVDKLY